MSADMRGSRPGRTFWHSWGINRERAWKGTSDMLTASPWYVIVAVGEKGVKKYTEIFYSPNQEKHPRLDLYSSWALGYCYTITVLQCTLKLPLPRNMVFDRYSSVGTFTQPEPLKYEYGALKIDEQMEEQPLRVQFNCIISNLIPSQSCLLLTCGKYVFLKGFGFI